MLEFRGWFDNLEWSEPSSGEVPRWLFALSIPAALAGACAVTATFGAFDVAPSLWMLLPALAAGIDWATGARSEPKTAIVAYAHALLLGGAIALLAFVLPSLALIGPCLAVASAPLLFRIWANTLFARDMITYMAERRELFRAAIAHEVEARVVRVEDVHGDQVELDPLPPIDSPSPNDAKNTPHWVADASVLPRVPRLRRGHHLVLEKPVLGELESIDGYRGDKRAFRLREAGEAHWLGSDPNTRLNLDFADEVRAGLLVMLAHHAVICALAFALSHALAPD